MHLEYDKGTIELINKKKKPRLIVAEMLFRATLPVEPELEPRSVES